MQARLSLTATLAASGRPHGTSSAQTPKGGDITLME